MKLETLIFDRSGKGFYFCFDTFCIWDDCLTFIINIFLSFNYPIHVMTSAQIKILRKRLSVINQPNKSHILQSLKVIDLKQVVLVDLSLQIAKKE